MPVFVIGFITLLVFIGIIVASQNQKAITPNLIVVSETMITPHTYTLGPEDAPVTLVEFSDFECPACKAAQPTVRFLEKTYQGQIKVAYRHFPLPQHQFSKSSAIAAQAAGIQGKFWEYADMLFQNQPALDKASLISYASQLGLDVTKFTTALDSAQLANDVEADYLYATKLNLQGTPAFFVNGKQVISNLEAEVQKALKEKSANTAVPISEAPQSTQTPTNTGDIGNPLNQPGAINIDYGDNGFSPKNITVALGQIVNWTNKTATDMVFVQRTVLYEELKEPKVLKAGESFELVMSKEKLWTYAEKNTNSFGSIFVVAKAK